MSQTNEVLASVPHPVYSTDVLIYDNVWTYVMTKHEELEECDGKNYCLEEVIQTLEDPDLIVEGRVAETEELFVRYTEMNSPTELVGYAVSTRTKDGITSMTTAYKDVLHPWNKGKIKYKKGDNDE